MIASHLYKMKLRYIRDTDKREVDFVVLKDRKPLFAVESKFSDKVVSTPLYYFQQRLNIPKYYQVSFKATKTSSPRDGIILTDLEGLCRLEKNGLKDHAKR